MTDDDVRRCSNSPERHTKPNPWMLFLLHRRIIDSGIGAGTYRFAHYIGDCVVKDRGLAQRAGVRFGWFNPQLHEPPPDFGANEFEFDTWSALD